VRRAEKKQDNQYFREIMMDQATQNTLYLLSCAVNDTKPDNAKVAGMDIEAVFNVASRHMVSAIVAVALKSAGLTNRRFSQAFAQAQRKAVILNNDLAQIIASFEENGIWYMPLKGAILKNLYPRFGMREMADIDMLIDMDKAADAKRILERLGFIAKSYGINNVDAYVKPPLSNVEIHKSLFGFQHDRKFYDYYEYVIHRLEKDTDNIFGYHFRPEDFYVYMIAHEYKHYQSAGTGLRSLLDTVVFLKKNKLDMKYIRQETGKLGISEFEAANRVTALSLLGGTDVFDSEMVNYIIESGTFGNLDHAVKNKMNKQGGGKIGYLLRRLLGIKSGNYSDYLKQRHPVFYKYKILLPFLPFYRLAYGVKKYPRRMKEEIKTVLRQ